MGGEGGAACVLVGDWKGDSRENSRTMSSSSWSGKSSSSSSSSADSSAENVGLLRCAGVGSSVKSRSWVERKVRRDAGSSVAGGGIVGGWIVGTVWGVGLTGGVCGGESSR